MPDKVSIQLPPQLTLEPARVAKVARYAHMVKHGRNRVPVSFQVALTDSCFNRCIGCGHPDRVQKRMEPDDWTDFLYSLPNLPESVCYSGGDPMAYPHFNRVMEWHLDNAVLFGCTITGYVPKSIDMNLLTHAAWIRVSLDALDPEVYEEVRGKTPLAKVLKSIDDMLEAGVNVQLGITLHPANEGQLPIIREWADAKGITDIDARYAYPKSNPMWDDVDMGTRGVQPFRTCKAALHQLYIDSDGSVYPCCITAGDTRSAAQGAALGNIFTDHWDRTLWPAVVAFSERKRLELPEVCRTCCVKRLSEINHIHDFILKDEPSFF